MQRFGRFLALAAVGLTVMLTVVDVAEARRSSSGFGSRGTRTFQTPAITRTAPNTATPIDRTMTQPGANQATGQQGLGQAARPGTPSRGLFGGFAGSMLGGLALGGLIGMMMGTGFGGGIGFLGLLLQMALIAGAVMLAMRFFGRGRQTASAGYAPGTASGRSGGSVSPLSGFGQGFGSQANREANLDAGSPGFSIPRIGGGNRPVPVREASAATDEIGIGPEDLDVFETILKQVQSAYAGEDYATLRKLTTPEAMSYLAEELSDNATKGLKNEVSNVSLVQGDVAESWREDNGDYATVAMRYESIDVLRERATGRVVEGDPDRLTETVELWTFLRKRGAEWQVSAIQGIAA